jgi:hypothetical protein
MPDTSTVIAPTQFVILTMGGTAINITSPIPGRTLAEFEEYATGAITTAVTCGLTGGLVVQWYDPRIGVVLAHAGLGSGHDDAIEITVDNDSIR